MRLDNHSYTPDLFRRILTLAGRLKSFDLAATALQTAADVSLTGRHVRRLTQEVGADLARQRDAEAARYRRRERPARVAQPPPLAVVEVDGGRLGTRQAGAGPGVHAPPAKEDKVACLVSMRSDSHPTDPQPAPPPAVRDGRRVARLVQQLQGQSAAPADEARPAALAVDAAPAVDAAERPGKPERLLRTCVASRNSSRAFGPLVAAEAQRGAFDEAPRQAFLGDGQKYNWQIQRTWFAHFVAISDFLHVVCYLYRSDAGEIKAGPGLRAKPFGRTPAG